MFFAILLMMLLIEFLVAFAVLMFTIFLTRPEVPLRPRKSLEADLAPGHKLLRCPRKPLSYSDLSRIPIPKFSYHLTFAVEAPMATTSGRPSLLRSATTSPEAAICVSSVCRSQLRPDASNA